MSSERAVPRLIALGIRFRDENSFRGVAVLALLAVLAWTGAQAQNQERKRGDPSTEAVERDVEYCKGGDISLLLDIYRPKERPKGLMPAVVWIHGGGWRGGDKTNAPNAPALAQRGYFVVSINYRLSGVAPFPAAVEDSKCAVRWLRANAKLYGVDLHRVGVWGPSAGGHLALMVGFADEKAGLEGKGGYAGVSSRVQAVCSWFGPTDFTKGHKEFESGRGAAPLAFLGGTLEEKTEVYRQASPITHVSKDDPPTLLIHGDRDAVVPFQQSEIMLDKLKEAGVNAALLHVKNGDHGFRGESDPSLKEIVTASFEFFDKYLKPSPAQPPQD